MISLDKSSADKPSKPKRYTLDDIFSGSLFDEGKGLIFLMDYIRDKYEIKTYVQDTYLMNACKIGMTDNKPALSIEFVLDDTTCIVRLVYVAFEYFELTLHKRSTVESLRGWYATKHLYFMLGTSDYKYVDKDNFSKLLESIDNLENEFKLLENT